ncbi:MAG: glycoside hydrolase family 3 protein [Lachnospiraceae bacterium]|jgi:beta-N-acetylhexosaminidase|nr:glycoside hydrolase family 3 protein [Lachnospiraceae bacterium]
MKRRRRRRRRNQNRLKGFILAVLLLLLAGTGAFLWKTALRRTEGHREEEPVKMEERLEDAGELPEQAEVPQESVDTGLEQLGQEPTQEELLGQRIEELLGEMTLEEKICQLFILTPDQLTGVSPVTAAGEATRSSLEKYPVGGLIYFSSNLVSEAQTKEMLEAVRDYGREVEGLPLFLCIDEEGGRVARIGNHPAFSVEHVRPMGEITSQEEAYEAGAAIGGYLRELGFNVDFAPDADVITNEKNTVIGDRSFGNDPQKVTELAAAVTEGLHGEGILSAFKHFPGHGATKDDTHEGYAYSERSYEELKSAELVPFAAAQECGVDMVMVAHISLPEVTGDHTPSSLSHRMITEILRGDLGYEGLVITDALNMGAIAKAYSSGEAAVRAVEAGVDLLLMPKNFSEACEGIQQAVLEERISEERLEESVRRILRVKLLMEE